MKKFCVCVLVLISACAIAQRTDSVNLPEVVVYGMPASQYAAGTKVVQLSNQVEPALLFQTLSEETSANFKNYGNSQLSTIAFRGTSASHTAVLWNGVSISSPTLGQTDFALLPTFLLEDIAVQYGTSSSLYGSDALGGSILLAHSKPLFLGTPKFQATVQYGSFGKKFTGLKGTYGSKRLEFRSKAFISDITNNFPYTAPQVGVRKRQNNASVKNFGFDQQVHYRINDNQRISLEGMYTDNFRNIQPTVTHDSPAGTLLDRNGRIALNYTNDMRKGVLFATAAYVSNYEVYSDTNAIKTRQLNLLVNFDMPLTSRISVRYGATTARYFATSSNFPGTVAENRYDGFISYKQLVGTRLTITANLRQSLYAGRRVPFTPSFGSEYRIVNRRGHRLTARAQTSRGYRIPTLNDRYWIPGGNPGLLPEDAFHAEGGVVWLRTQEKSSFQVEATTFHTWVSQWILWQPTENGIWTPTNLQKVHARGMESSVKYYVSRARVNWVGAAHYAYTVSENKKGLNEFDTQTVGKQLPYVPVHTANAFVKALMGSWWWQARTRYTSRRFIALDNDEGQSLRPYALLDINIGKVVTIGQSTLKCGAEVNNILNTYYENNKSYAMPGRNYQITITVNF